MNDFSLLPPHVISLILHHLEFADLLRACGTCKSWYYAACDPVIAKTICVKFQKDLCNVQHIRRPFSKLNLEYINFNGFKYRDFFMKFGHAIDELRMVQCTISLEQLIECLIYLTNLTKFEILVKKKTLSMKKYHPTKLIKSSPDTLEANLCRIKQFCVISNSPDCDGIQLIMTKTSNLKRLIYYIGDFSKLDNGFVFQNLFGYMNHWDEVNLDYFEIGNICVSSAVEFFNSFATITKPINVRIMKLVSFEYIYHNDDFKTFWEKLSRMRTDKIRVTSNQQLHDIYRHMTNLKANELRPPPMYMRIVGELKYIEKINPEQYDIFFNEVTLTGASSFSVNLNDLIELDPNEPVLNSNLIVLCQNHKKEREDELYKLGTDNHPVYKNFIATSVKGKLRCDENITYVQRLEVL